MKKVTITSRDLEKLYGHLKSIESGVQGLMDIIDEKYVELVVQENILQRK